MNAILRLLRPTLCAESVPEIDIAELKRLGVQALLLDLDNTLVLWRGWDIPAAVLDWVKEALAQGMKVCIVSNTRNPKRVQQLAEELGISYVRRGMKPRRGGFRDALKLLGVERAESAVVGDQIFTDVLGGNRLGVLTVLVSPMGSREFFGTKISRFFERMVLGMLERRGMLRRCGAETQSRGEHLPETGSQKESEMEP